MLGLSKHRFVVSDLSSLTGVGFRLGRDQRGHGDRNSSESLLDRWKDPSLRPVLVIWFLHDPYFPPRTSSGFLTFPTQTTCPPRPPDTGESLLSLSCRCPPGTCRLLSGSDIPTGWGSVSLSVKESLSFENNGLSGITPRSLWRDQDNEGYYSHHPYPLPWSLSPLPINVTYHHAPVGERSSRDS